MTRVILVHGMNANGLSWNGLQDHSDLSNHTVEVVTLAGHDQPAFPGGAVPNTDTSAGKVLFMAALALPAASLATMDDYIASVVAAFPPAPDGVEEPKDVCLVGHSMGGAVISHVAAARPERVSRLIYVSAMLPDDLQTINELMGQVGAADGYSLFGPAEEFGAYLPGIASALVKQPKLPKKARFNRSSAFDQIPIHYIRCARDSIISCDAQKEMLAKYSAAKQKELATGHVPQYEDRNALAATIKEILENG